MASCRAGVGADGGSRRHRRGIFDAVDPPGVRTLCPESEDSGHAGGSVRGLHTEEFIGRFVQELSACAHDGLKAGSMRQHRCAPRVADGSIRSLAWDRRGRPAPNGRLEGGQDAGGRRRVGAPWRHDPTRHATRTMANARSSARPTPAASVVRRRAGLVAVSLAGSLAGLAAGTAGGVWGTPAGRGPSSGSSTIAPGQAVARPPGSASSGVAMVLAPASAPRVERPGREDGSR